MARPLRSRRDLQGFLAKEELLRSPRTPYLLKLQLTGITRRGGYISTLARQQRKTAKQLTGLPGCGPSLKEWLL